MSHILLALGALGVLVVLTYVFLRSRRQDPPLD